MRLHRRLCPQAKNVHFNLRESAKSVDLFFSSCLFTFVADYGLVPMRAVILPELVFAIWVVASIDASRLYVPPV